MSSQGGEFGGVECVRECEGDGEREKGGAVERERRDSAAGCSVSDVELVTGA